MNDKIFMSFKDLIQELFPNVVTECMKDGQTTLGIDFDVLKLLRETYLNKIKMIYIDPPYNTGNVFIYNDKFTI